MGKYCNCDEDANPYVSKSPEFNKMNFKNVFACICEYVFKFCVLSTSKTNKKFKTKLHI